MLYREIPYNYTSFSDKEIVYRILGKPAWALILSLREDRQTGLSAKMLFEIIGDIWIVRRNPYLQEDLLKNNKRFNALISALKHRLEQIIKRYQGDSRVKTLIQNSQQAIKDFQVFLANIKDTQERIKKNLSRITSNNNIRLDALSRSSHSTDASDWRVAYPLVVITPDTELEVALLVKACIDLGLTIIPRGGGTGYTGSVIPLTENTAIINTEKLLHLDKPDKTQGFDTISVGAGVVTKRVSEAAQAADLVFAVDPTSQDACTIGGNIAMNAGGKKAVRWGTTIDNLLSWKMVLPDGNWLEVKRLEHNLDKIHNVKTVHFELCFLDEYAKKTLRTEKLSIASKQMRAQNLGKDVTNKFLSGLPGMQKEGCDGLITSAVFVLHKNSPYSNTICLEFFDNKTSDAVNAIVEIKQSIDANPETDVMGLEHLDARYIKAVNYSTKAKQSGLPNMVLLMDLGAQTQDALTAQSNIILALTKQKGGEGFIAKNTTEQHNFWLDRANTAAIASHTNAFKINEDVVIPLAKLAQYNDEIERINIELTLENKLAAAIEINQYLTKISQEQNDEICAKKYQLSQEILAKTITIWQGLLTQLEDANTAGIHSDVFKISLDKHIIEPLFELCIGDIFKSVRKEITDIVRYNTNIALFVATHMHAGDGNVHTNIPVHSHIPKMLTRAEKVVDEIMLIATKLGGVISGEHGIGLTKFAYLSPVYKDEFANYKQRVDPNGVFNQGKLLKGSGLENAYTPSLRLLEKEALILENSEIGQINNMTKSCLRCGKCKPVCTTHIPEANLLYSPRDKIIGSNLIIEAFLYEEQTRRGISLGHFDQLDDIADHCTICHRCEKPCPVNIDFGEVSIKMRHILKKHGKKRSNIAAKASMMFLNANKPMQIKVNKSLLNIAYKTQRIAHKITKLYHQDKPNISLGNPSFPTEIITLLDKPLPNDTGIKPFRQLLNIEESSSIPIIFNPNKTDNSVIRTILYFPGCGSERLFSQIGLATMALLYHQGVRIVLPPGYLCCGYPQRASGDLAKAKQISTDNRVLMHRMNNTLNYLEISDIITSCGTCIDQLFDYDLAQIFKDARLLDIHEYLLEMKVTLSNNQRKYLYHAPCHDPIKSADSNTVINQLMGVEALNNDRCCGESGTFAVARPDIAKQVKFKKENQIKQDLVTLINQPKANKNTQPVTMLTTCPACRQGLARYEENTGIDTKYPIEIMAETLLGKDWQTNFISKAKIEKVLL